MGDPGPLRASDSERERSADDLREHYTSGRITAQELSDRLDAVYAASTHSELAALSGDLPALRTAPTVDPQRDLARRRVYQDAGRVALLNVACVAVWLAAGGHGDFWPVWVMLASLLRLGQDAWRLLGPGGDPSTAGRDGGGSRRERRERRRSLGP